MKITRKSSVTASSDSFEQKLKAEVTDKVREVMLSPEFGFDDDGEYAWKNYTFILVTPFDDSRLKVKVISGLSYEGMIKLAKALDPIVQKYDEYAYFDMENYGIANAIVEVPKTVESTETITADRFDPPEAEGEVVDSFEEVIKIKLIDDDVLVDEYGHVRFKDIDDTDIPMEADDYKCESYPIYLNESEYVGDVIEEELYVYLPEDGGEYKVSCDVTVRLTVSGLYAYPEGDYDTQDLSVYADKVTISDFKFIRSK